MIDVLICIEGGKRVERLCEVEISIYKVLVKFREQMCSSENRIDMNDSHIVVTAGVVLRPYDPHPGNRIGVFSLCGVLVYERTQIN